MKCNVREIIFAIEITELEILDGGIPYAAHGAQITPPLHIFDFLFLCLF